MISLHGCVRREGVVLWRLNNRRCRKSKTAIIHLIVDEKSHIKGHVCTALSAHTYSLRPEGFGYITPL
jgi:hypothetical protein